MTMQTFKIETGPLKLLRLLKSRGWFLSISLLNGWSRVLQALFNCSKTIVWSHWS